MAQFDRFSERARKVLSLAQEEAGRFNHNYIATEHLLLGLVREGDGVAARVLNNMGVQLPKVRVAVEFIIGRGEGQVVGDIGLTPRAKKVLELAVDESRRFNHRYVGTEHLLLGLIREGEGIAAGVLESLGVKLDNVRTHVMSVLEGKPLPEPKSPPPVLSPRINQLSGRTVALIARAHEEADRLGHPTVATIHLVMALFREENSPTASALGGTFERIDDIREELESLYPPSGESSRPERPLGERAAFILARARLEAVLRTDQLVTPEHVLLALVATADEGERALFGALDIDLAEIGSRVKAVLDDSGASS